MNPFLLGMKLRSISPRQIAGLSNRVNEGENDGK